jgi:hypothetical protein
MPTRSLLVCLATVGLMAVGASGASAQLVTNGGFESGDLTGWTTSGACGEFVWVSSTPYAGVVPQHSGSYGLLAGPYPPGICTVSQDISTVAGQSYALDFWLALDWGATSAVITSNYTPNFFNALWGGTSLTSMTDAAPFAYTHYSYNVTGGAGTSTELAFQFRNDPAGWSFDDVAVERLATVPEPAGLLLLFTGLIGVAGVARRRRQDHEA